MILFYDYARRWCHLTLHIINVEKNVSRLLFHILFLPYLCLHNLGLVRVEVRWVCFDVLFFIAEFHFLFLFILFHFRLLVYICVVGVFLYGVKLFVSMFVSMFIWFVVLFRFYSLFVFIYCLCYVTVLYQFFFESICCSKMRLSYSACLLIDCIQM
jgi:hypothetical protein